MRCTRVLRTPADRARIRPLHPGEPPTVLPDPEQALLDAAWLGGIDGLISGQVARRYGLARSLVNHVRARILQGKSPDPRFDKPAGSSFHDKRTLISSCGILCREAVAGPHRRVPMDLHRSRSRRRGSSMTWCRPVRSTFLPPERCAVSACN
jgi:hypothetical protein